MNYNLMVPHGSVAEFYVENARMVLESHPKPLLYVLDIGAHIGCVSIMAVKEWGAKFVVAVEPVYENFIMLVRNIHENGCDNSILPVRAAVTNNTGDRVNLYSQEIRDGFENSGVYTLKSSMGESRAATSISFRDVIGLLPQIDLLKIDIEGAEWDIMTPENRPLFDRATRVDLEVHGEGIDYLGNHAGAIIR